LGRGFMLRKMHLIIIFILLNIIGIACSQIKDPSGHERSELNLTVSFDKQEMYANQGVQIYFNFSNKERDPNAYANEVNFITGLSKSFAWPKEEMHIINNGKQDSKDFNGELELCSNFNKHNPGRGDWAKILQDGTISIHFASLDSGEKISIKYITKYISNSIYDPQVLFTTNRFEWDVQKDNIEVPISPPFIRLNHNPKIDTFNVSALPIENIISWKARNCTILNQSKIFFYITPYDADNDTLNITYLDCKIDPYSPPIPFENGSTLNDTGMHQFRIKASDSIESNSTNSTYFGVTDLVKYHKNLITDVFDVNKYETLLPSWILLLISYIFLIKKDLLRNKTKLGRYLMLISILIVLILGIYYNHPEGYYKSLLWLESGGLIISFLSYIFYILCAGESCILLNSSEFRRATIVMVTTVLIFHYFLPDILSRRESYTFLLASLLIFLIFILKVRDKIEAIFINTNKVSVPTPNDLPSLYEEVENERKKHIENNESKGHISTGTFIVVEIVLLSILIYFTATNITFKPRFALFDLVIIGIMEVSLLITVVATALHPDILIEIFESEVPLAKILLQKIFRQNHPK
jgi:hypothetical protein